MAPYGITDARMDLALQRAAGRGVPVVRVGRGNAEGFTRGDRLVVGGSNLTATKARMLLMAGLLRYGMLSTAEDAKLRSMVAVYQALFDSH
jgi:L-asparaginase